MWVSLKRSSNTVHICWDSSYELTPLLLVQVINRSFQQPCLSLSLAYVLLQRICCRMSAKFMFLKGFSAAMEEHKSKGAFEPGTSNTRLRQVKLETSTEKFQSLL